MSSYLRVKRKRCEDPLPTVVVDGNGCERLRKRRNIADAMEKFSVSTNVEKKNVEVKKATRMVFKRVRTIDIDTRKKKRRRKTEQRASLLEEKGFVRSSVSVLEPDEIEMDKAIWTAFRTGSFDQIFRLITHGTRSVNFQRRASDNTTALMAAAHQGNLKIAKQLLEMGADMDLKSAHNHTASDIARSRGHENIVKYIQSFKEKKKKDNESDFVYDIYRVCDVDFDEAAIVKTSSTSNERYRGIVCGRDVEEFDDADWEFKILNETENEFDNDNVDEYDSNAEDHFGNDYPDEEEEDEEYDGGSSSGYDRESCDDDDDDDFNSWY